MSSLGCEWPFSAERGHSKPGGLTSRIRTLGLSQKDSEAPAPALPGSAVTAVLLGQPGRLPGSPSLRLPSLWHGGEPRCGSSWALV